MSDYTDQSVSDLIVNKLTLAKYTELKNAGSLQADQLYQITDLDILDDDMTGADGTNAGKHGLVPAPAASANGKYLRGDGTWQTPTNTKNTAGSTDTSSKIFLVGATSQAASPQTYSHDTAFVDTNGRLNSAAPATDANDTTVATTKWVKDQGYNSGTTAVSWGSITGTLSNQTDLNTALGNKANNSDVVKLTGSQTVAGQKTFTDRLVLQQSSVQPLLKSTGYTKGTAPTSDTYMCHRTYSDKNGAGVFDEYYYIQGNTNKNRYILRFQNVSSASATGYKDIITADFDGTTSTYAVNATTATAPTPATSDNSTKIATTAFVKAQNYITSSSSITGSAAKLTTKRTIDGVEFDGSANITHYGTCSTDAATQEKAVTCTGFKLETGAIICVKFTTEANGADNPTLNVNSTGAKAIQYRGGAISKGYLRINRTYVFVYDGTYYQLIGDLDSNTTDRLQIANNIKAATAITAGRAIVGTSAGYKNIGSGITFDISYPILVAGSAISASSTGTNNFRAISGRSVRDITGNSSWTGTQYATVYLVLSALDGVTATIDSTLATTTVPTSADNKFYIPLGYMYSTYQCYFCPQDKIYAYTNGKFQEYGASGGGSGDYVSKSECEEVQCVVETWHSGTYWYRIWSDGWIETGMTETVGNSTSKICTFAHTFSDTNYVIECTQTGDSTSYNNAMSVIKTSASQFTVNNANGGSINTFYIYACGY